MLGHVKDVKFMDQGNTVQHVNSLCDALNINFIEQHVDHVVEVCRG